jgi:hypothetical protein
MEGFTNHLVGDTIARNLPDGKSQKRGEARRKINPVFGDVQSGATHKGNEITRNIG